MTHLIEELVELARGDVQMPAKRPVRLDHLVEEVVAAAARRSAAVFRTDLSPTHVAGAPSSLTGAIANLIDNAVKWSPEGAPVEVSVRDGTVTVRDHGPGIDAADLPHIFDRFYRAPAARTLPGSGLGLAIVRQVAEAHGGSATAEPAPGGGSLFTLRLPVSKGSLNETRRQGRGHLIGSVAKAVPTESSAQST
jgi:signal transduction histidine kinase